MAQQPYIMWSLEAQTPCNRSQNSLRITELAEMLWERGPQHYREFTQGPKALAPMVLVLSAKTGGNVQLRGSKYPIFKASGPKNHSGYGFWNQKPGVLGAWTL